ncbi:Asp23/Gls24 family envelope stress response protein [Nocardia sp. NPDC051570]|uniref:Asp23/Gls24 family envelope stress response protein n=1 Tax=Nocardia sp. NPDC051570 TaxID=3364324 RepID=UPI0037ADBD58
MAVKPRTYDNAANSTDSDEYVLPCGRTLERVWQRLDSARADSTDDHEANCPHCRAARESLLALRGATRELIEADDEPSPDLLGRIMSAVQAEMRRGKTLPLPTDVPGAVVISEQAVAVVLRYAADTVAGVRARRCRVRDVGRGPEGATIVDVELTVVVRSDGVIGDLIPQVRERVAAAASGRVGLRVQRLDIVVDDIYREGPQ